MDIINPATLEVIDQIPWLGAKEAKQVVNQASTAYDQWSRLSPFTRATYLHKLAEVMTAEKDALAACLTEEQGKPLKEAAREIDYAIGFLTNAAEEGKRLQGEILPSQFQNKKLFVTRNPLGVVACITPWNFPSAMVTRKIGPALACGNTVVLKPSELTPLSALAIERLSREVGFPEGVFTVITGDSEAISSAWLEDARVKKLSFTGSTRVGRSLIKRSSTHMTKLSLELGGQAPFIVFDDADLEKAVSCAIQSKFRNAGQTCICANRFYIQSGIYESFLSMFTEKVKALKVGNGLDPETDIGPIIVSDKSKNILSDIKEAIQKGASCRLGGELVTIDGNNTHFLAPTILENCTPEMLVCTEETFGPVAPFMSFETEDEALQLANATDYGLAAYVFTSDTSRLFKFSDALEFGLIGANDIISGGNHAPFGGFKSSGYGREGGKYAMDEYSQLKTISLSL